MAYVIKGRHTGEYAKGLFAVTDSRADALRFDTKTDAREWAQSAGYSNGRFRIVRLVKRKPKPAPPLVEVIEEREPCGPWHAIYASGIRIERYVRRETAEATALRIREAFARGVHAVAHTTDLTNFAMLAHAIVQWGYAMALFVERRRSETLFRLYERGRDENIRLRGACPNSTVEAYGLVLSVLADAIDMGGITSGSLAEKLGCTVGALHGYGLQAVANAITEASEVERAREKVCDSGVVVCEEPIDHMLFRLVQERDDARRDLAAAVARAENAEKCLSFTVGAGERVVDAARLFRKADTGGGFNDRVACGNVLDAALANYAQRALGLVDSHDADAAEVAKKVGMP